ncbi:uncharacterized protein LOC124163358 isoform X2 [Ischnura elegans]|uniref:uncharacterized protein LOC124163358 isoform X2 n=1 Tax=Ischnura elegans TaxID=197161 RepID=UPI001ED8934D|nr:uncharacterized protein LOC124163358 isoform X2 [Ischnura elegans]XP_046396176.1 uncharacterized protein LOC124163358 isoform X2 [Ischnura elegans]
MASWTKNQVEAFIAAIMDKPYLYDPKEYYYKSKAMRTMAMEEIAQSLCSVRPNTTAHDCKRKWHSLRTNYLSEKKKIIRSKMNGAAGDLEYVPSLFYFKSMSFIDDHIQVKVNTSTLDDDEEESSLLNHQEWEEDIHDEDRAMPSTEAMKEEYPSPLPIAPQPPYRVPATHFPPPPDVLYRTAPGGSQQAEPIHIAPGPSRQEPAIVPDRTGESAPAASLLTAAAGAMGTLSNLVAPEDAEGAFGKYVACRLRNVKNEREKSELMFMIEKVFYEHSQK